MAGARDHRDEHDDNAAPAGVARRVANPDHAPAIAGPRDPRLIHAGAGAGLMQLQRTAGNAAVASMVAPAVQRAVEINEISTTPTPDTAGDTTGGVEDGGPTEINGSSIALNAPMVTAPGVLQVDTLIANTVVGSSYTPGAGNLF